MGFHVWYHAHYLNDVELDRVWVTTKPYTDTAVWAQNSDYWQGMDKIRAYYGPKVDQKMQAGGFQFHTLTSQIVVVADDRRTAKGVWYTPGMVGGYNGGSWLWERYGVDFVNENGSWKIWHLHVYTDFGAPVNLGSGMGGPPGAGQPQVEASYQARIGYRELGANSYPVLIPRPPEAYRTFSETWSYADPDEYARALEAIGVK